MHIEGGSESVRNEEIPLQPSGGRQNNPKKIGKNK